MKVQFAFGKQGVALTLPERYSYRILEARTAEPLPNESAAIEDAISSPIASPALKELASGKQSAAISVCDITRPAPNRTVLPPILAALESAGIPRESITLFIATGLHRPATPNEINEILGQEIAGAYRVVNHNARQLDDHRYLGETVRGTPVYIEERFVAADLRITLGFIEPHLMLGFSGGRKLIAPGLAAQETIKVLHSPKFMRDPKSVEGSVDDNPLHHELLEIAKLAGHDFMVDVALTRDRKIAAVFAGDPRAAHRKGREFVGRVMLEQLPQPADAVITSAAGYPLDLTFYQAIKGVTAAQHVVKPGGRILLVAQCGEGAGAPEFCDMLRLATSGGEFLNLIADRPVVVDQWQLEKLALVTERARLLFYTPGLPESFHSTLWGRAFSDPESAMSELVRDLPDGATIAVMPEGPYVLAKAGGHA